MPQKHKEEWKTEHGVFDDFTNKTIYKLITQGHFDGLESPLFIGKESNVFTAIKEEKRVVVKIYRLENCDFNQMYSIIRLDPRYFNVKKRRREVIFAWVQREYRNIMLSREAGVRVPTPLTVMNNVLVLEYIGDDNGAAPKLKDSFPQNPTEFLEDIIKNMKKLHAIGLVHGDLSPFNILNFHERPVFIDFSQCATNQSTIYNVYLERDAKNIANFFSKHKIPVTKEEIVRKITKK